MFQTPCKYSKHVANVSSALRIKTGCKCFKRVANIQNTLQMLAPRCIRTALLIPEKNNMRQVTSTVLYGSLCWKVLVWCACLFRMSSKGGKDKESHVFGSLGRFMSIMWQTTSVRMNYRRDPPPSLVIRCNSTARGKPVFCKPGSLTLFDSHTASVTCREHQKTTIAS